MAVDLASPLPPNDLAMERALLGAALLDGGSAVDDLPWFQADMFYLHRHRWVWDAVVELRAEGEPVDFLTIMRRLEAHGQLAEVGGAAYLTRLITDTPSSLHAEGYARAVAREALRRRAIDYATRVAKSAYGTDLVELHELLAAGPDLALHTAPSAVRDAAAVASEVWDDVADPSKLTGRMVPTGLLAWDNTLGGGLERGTLGVLMARPSMGKTAVLCQVADFVSEHIGPVVFFTKEMGARQILLRLACRRARVSGLALRQNKVSPDDRQAVLAEIEALSRRDTLWLDDSTPQTTTDAAAVALRLDARRPLALVIADHLRLFADSDPNANENKRLGAVSWGLKQLARRLDVPVLAAAQLNRAVEGQSDRRPDLKDLRDSGEIEENADTVTALYRDSYYTDSQTDKTAELINRKAREGERNARATFVFLPGHMSFEPLTRNFT